MKFNLTFKIWILIICLLLSFLAIFSMPPIFLKKGVLITSIELNSTAFEHGLREGQIITEIDGYKIRSLEDFSNSLKGKYSSGENEKTIFKIGDSEIILFSKEAPEIIVSELSKTNLKMGLDIVGGSRALIQARDKKLSFLEIKDLADVTSNRLNEFGLSDLKVLPVSDLSGNNFMLVEIAEATPNDLEDLLSKQGKFEAKIGNETVFIGGKKDIASVSRNAQESFIESCQKYDGGRYFCNFRFAIYLSEESANRHAKITENLSMDLKNPEFLSEKLDLYLDDKLVDSLLISKELKGRVTTQISISGSGSGQNQEEAYNSASKEMHRLQTILITGSLPYKLEIIKLDTISPLLGKEFIKVLIIAGFIAFFGVSIIIFFANKKFKSSLAVIFTSFSEIFIILGIASLIEWNLDLPSIAGILTTIGTGIDQQIIILDESKQNKFLSIRQRIRKAFLIILGAYFTTLVSLIPLYWAGAGLLKGFAITSIIGISVGILVTRPAFADIVKNIEE